MTAEERAGVAAQTLALWGCGANGCLDRRIKLCPGCAQAVRILASIAGIEMPEPAGKRRGGK